MLDSLYSNIGAKIKNWAKWICVVETISAIIGGITLMAEEEFLYGLLCLIVGPIVAFVSTWLLYAFGEITEDIGLIRQKYVGEKVSEQQPENILAQAATNNMPRAPKMPEYLSCEKCNEKITHYPCEHCGHQIEKKAAPYWCGKCGYLGPFVDKCPSCGSGIKIFNIKK